MGHLSLSRTVVFMLEIKILTSSQEIELYFVFYILFDVLVSRLTEERRASDASRSLKGGYHDSTIIEQEHRMGYFRPSTAINRVLIAG